MTLKTLRETHKKHLMIALAELRPTTIVETPSDLLIKQETWALLKIYTPAHKRYTIMADMYINK